MLKSFDLVTGRILKEKALLILLRCKQSSEYVTIQCSDSNDAQTGETSGRGQIIQTYQSAFKVGKVFEKFLLRRLGSILDKKSIFPDH